MSFNDTPKIIYNPLPEREGAIDPIALARQQQERAIGRYGSRLVDAKNRRQAQPQETIYRGFDADSESAITNNGSRQIITNGKMIAGRAYSEAAGTIDGMNRARTRPRRRPRRERIKSPSIAFLLKKSVITSPGSVTRFYPARPEVIEEIWVFVTPQTPYPPMGWTGRYEMSSDKSYYCFGGSRQPFEGAFPGELLIKEPIENPRRALQFEGFGGSILYVARNLNGPIDSANFPKVYEKIGGRFGVCGTDEVEGSWVKIFSYQLSPAQPARSVTVPAVRIEESYYVYQNQTFYFLTSIDQTLFGGGGSIVIDESGVIHVDIRFRDVELAEFEDEQLLHFQVKNGNVTQVPSATHWRADFENNPAPNRTANLHPCLSSSLINANSTQTSSYLLSGGDFATLGLWEVTDFPMILRESSIARGTEGECVLGSGKTYNFILPRLPEGDYDGWFFGGFSGIAK